MGSGQFCNINSIFLSFLSHFNLNFQIQHQTYVRQYATTTLQPVIQYRQHRVAGWQWSLLTSKPDYKYCLRQLIERVESTRDEISDSPNVAAFLRIIYTSCRLYRLDWIRLECFLFFLLAPKTLSFHCLRDYHGKKRAGCNEKIRQQAINSHLATCPSSLHFDYTMVNILYPTSSRRVIEFEISPDFVSRLDALFWISSAGKLS